MATPAAPSLISDLHEADFAKEVEQSPIPVFIDFHATWCGPCKALAPLFDTLAQTYGDQVKFVKVDIDDNKELAQRLSLRRLPEHGSRRLLELWACRHGRSSVGELGQRAMIFAADLTIDQTMLYRRRRNCRLSACCEVSAMRTCRRSNSCHSWQTRVFIWHPSRPFIACNAVWDFALGGERRVAQISLAAARSIAQSNPIKFGVGISRGCRHLTANRCERAP